MEKIRNRINRLIAEETGKLESDVEKDTDRDYWMSAPEARTYGLINSVITVRTELG
jgi:ATP-dependent Clp protease protease subunit